MNNDNGFSKACPSGNIMIDGFHDENFAPCKACQELGRFDYTDMERLIDDVAVKVYQLNKTGTIIKDIKDIFALINKTADKGIECEECGGTGKILL